MENQNNEGGILVERNIQPKAILLNDPNAIVELLHQDLVASQREMQKADKFVKANACSKLQVIVEQMKYLKKQAESILIETDWNMKLHHVACNFIKQPGHVYHLYETQSGQLCFSRLSPEEWGNSGPVQIYKGSYRLEQDQSWTYLEKTNNKNEEMTKLTKLRSHIASTIFSSNRIDLGTDT